MKTEYVLTAAHLIPNGRECFIFCEQHGLFTPFKLTMCFFLYRSANIGVFICLKCSGIHRSLGTHISKVSLAATRKKKLFDLLDESMI